MRQQSTIWLSWMTSVAIAAFALPACGDKDGDSGAADDGYGSDGTDGTDGTDGSDGTDGTDGTDGSDGSETAVTYADVAPILETHCTSCHTDGGSAPFSLETYADAGSRSARIVARAVDGEGSPMPPSGLSLSSAEADLVVAWDAAGAPE